MYRNAIPIIYYNKYCDQSSGLKHFLHKFFRNATYFKAAKAIFRSKSAILYELQRLINGLGSLKIRKLSSAAGASAGKKQRRASISARGAGQALLFMIELVGLIHRIGGQVNPQAAEHVFIHGREDHGGVRLQTLELGQLFNRTGRHLAGCGGY